MAPTVHLDNRERPVRLARSAQWELLAQQEQLDHLDRKVNVETPEMMELQENKDRKDS